MVGEGVIDGGGVSVDVDVWVEIGISVADGAMVLSGFGAGVGLKICIVVHPGRAVLIRNMKKVKHFVFKRIVFLEVTPGLGLLLCREQYHPHKSESNKPL